MVKRKMIVTVMEEKYGTSVNDDSIRRVAREDESCGDDRGKSDIAERRMKMTWYMGSRTWAM